MHSLKSSPIHLVCPVCKSELIHRGDTIHCLHCNKDWSEKEGIPDFRLRKDKYWGWYPQDKMEQLIKRYKETGMQASLKEFFLKPDPSSYDYMLDEKRANWHMVIPLKEDARILDAGCGWGTLSFALSRVYKEVVAFDVSVPLLEFVNLRRQDESISNLTPLCGQINYLPFPDNYFDLVVLNGVLEWAPLIESEKDPKAVQAELLKEVYRVLKKDGFLYLAIENRWSIINFLGFRDTHSGLRFVSLLPRFLANMYSRFVRKKDFREYTYSYGEHKRILKHAGFFRTEFYAPLPSYRNFYYLIPIDDPLKVKFFVQHLLHARRPLHALLKHLVNSFSLYSYVKYFVPDFSIIAQKEKNA